MEHGLQSCLQLQAKAPEQRSAFKGMSLIWVGGSARAEEGAGGRQKIRGMRRAGHMSLFSFKLLSRATEHALTSREQRLSKLSVSMRLIPFNYLLNQEVKRDGEALSGHLAPSCPVWAISLLNIKMWGQNKGVLLLFWAVTKHVKEQYSSTNPPLPFHLSTVFPPTTHSLWAGLAMSLGYKDAESTKCHGCSHRKVVCQGLTWSHWKTWLTLTGPKEETIPQS